MKLFIAVDREGICGVLNENDTAYSGPAADVACGAMRADLDAVLEGCRAAGADQIIVCDAHGNGRSLSADGLPSGVTLVSGSPSPGSMLEGLDDGCDAALFVGYHARAGARAAVLEHTWNYKVFGVFVGGLELGEFGIAAMLAGHHRVPTVYLSGDDKTAVEAAELVPGITTTVVKRGISRYAAELYPADEVRSRMTADAERALRSPKPALLRWQGDPMRLVFTRPQFCDLAEACPGVVRTDGRTLEIAGATFADIYASFLACVRLSEGGD